jgi:putative oxidoreductase
MMKNLSEIAYTALRAGSGILLIYFHGWSKLRGCAGYVFRDEPWRFMDTVARLGFPFPGVFAALAALIETLGAALLIAGLFTRYAAAAIAATMLVAIYRHVSSDMRIESATLYFLVVLLFILQGPGRWSLDSLLYRPEGDL